MSSENQGKQTNVPDRTRNIGNKTPPETGGGYKLSRRDTIAGVTAILLGGSALAADELGGSGDTGTEGPGNGQTPVGNEPDGDEAPVNGEGKETGPNGNQNEETGNGEENSVDDWLTEFQQLQQTSLENRGEAYDLMEPQYTSHTFFDHEVLSEALEIPLEEVTLSETIHSYFPDDVEELQVTVIPGARKVKSDLLDDYRNSTSFDIIKDMGDRAIIRNTEEEDELLFPTFVYDEEGIFTADSEEDVRDYAEFLESGSPADYSEWTGSSFFDDDVVVASVGIGRPARGSTYSRRGFETIADHEGAKPLRDDDITRYAISRIIWPEENYNEFVTDPEVGAEFEERLYIVDEEDEVKRIRDGRHVDPIDILD